jgi:hypothetical protein
VQKSKIYRRKGMSTIIIAIVVSVAAIIGYGSYLIFGPDNKVEEACEEIIKVETGETIDFSPNESKNTIDLSPTAYNEKEPEALLQQAPEQPQIPGANGPSESSSIQ